VEGNENTSPGMFNLKKNFASYGHGTMKLVHLISSTALMVEHVSVTISPSPFTSSFGQITILSSKVEKSFEFPIVIVMMSDLRMD